MVNGEVKLYIRTTGIDYNIRQEAMFAKVLKWCRSLYLATKNKDPGPQGLRITLH